MNPDVNWIIIIVLIIILIWYVLFRNPQISAFDQLNNNYSAQNQYVRPTIGNNPSQQHPNTNVNNFRHELPKKEFANLVAEFGKPDVIENKPYGLALWKNKGYFDVIMLLDESIQHNYPAAHCDFLYSIITVYIPNELVCMVLDLSETITYDKLKSQLSVRCRSMGANVATLYLALKIVAEPNNIDYYKSQYVKLIASTTNKQNYLNLQNQLEQLVAQNHSIYKNELSSINQNCLIGQ